jgi:hypothetical protein
VYAVGFKATTSGERLFQFVLNEIFLADSFSSVRALTMLEIGARREELSEYFVGAGAMNILGRCIKKAQRVLDGDNEADYQPMMVTFIQRVLEVPRRGDDLVDQFARLALSAAGAANRGKVNPSTKKLVMDSRTEAPCYLCGAMCLLSSEEESAQVEFEHLWPSSFGGESTFENLLPAWPPFFFRIEAEPIGERVRLDTAARKNRSSHEDSIRSCVRIPMYFKGGGARGRAGEYPEPSSDRA